MPGTVGSGDTLHTFNIIMTTECIPSAWRNSILVPIFKEKGDVQECKNYRGIQLLTHTFKIWEKVVDRMLRECTEIHESQFGFMPGRSTTDAIFILKQTIEKHREGQKVIRVTFIDIEKAYDRVPREEIWRCMRERNVPEKYVKLIQDMYRGCKTKVRSPVCESDSFNVDVGLHQGSALSPYLFLILMDVLTEGVRNEVPESMMFADDIVLCAGREVDMTEYFTSVWKQDTRIQELEEDGSQRDGGAALQGRGCGIRGFVGQLCGERRHVRERWTASEWQGGSSFSRGTVRGGRQRLG